MKKRGGSYYFLVPDEFVDKLEEVLECRIDNLLFDLLLMNIGEMGPALVLPINQVEEEKEKKNGKKD